MMPDLFGTDGIRGNFGEFPLQPAFVRRIGFATGTVLLRTAAEQPTIVIGRDTRYSGKILQDALSEGLLASGMTVIDVGEITTPGVAYLTHRLNAQAGIVVSASHNPAEENGIKLFDPSGSKLSETSEQAITDLLNADDGRLPSIARGQMIEDIGLQKLYLGDLMQEHRETDFRGIRVVLDCANGAASELAPEAFKRLGFSVTAIHSSPTGANINETCGSEHVRRHPQDMARQLQMHDAEFGVAFDGDADRVVFVDKGGMIIDGDYMLGLFADQFMQKGRLLEQAVVTTIMRNEGLRRFLVAKGLTLWETKVGDRYVSDKLLELRRGSHQSQPNAIGLGGEQAGHLVLMDEQHITGDGLRTALHFIRAFVSSGVASLRSWANTLQKTPQVIASAYVGKSGRWSRPELDVRESDLLRRSAGLLRVSLRYSGTEPLFRVMIEGDESRSSAQLADLAYNECVLAQKQATTQGRFMEILDCAYGGLLNSTKYPSESRPDSHTR